MSSNTINNSTRRSSRVRHVINRDYSPPGPWGRQSTPRRSTRAPRPIIRDNSQSGAAVWRPSVAGATTSPQNRGRRVLPPVAPVAVQPPPVAAPVVVIAPAGVHNPRRSTRAPRPIMRDHSPPRRGARRPRVAAPGRQNRGRSTSPRSARRARVAARPRAASVGGGRRVTFAAQLTQIRLIPHRLDPVEPLQIHRNPPMPMVIEMEDNNVAPPPAPSSSSNVWGWVGNIFGFMGRQ